jgi:hypothetical protein
LQLTPIAGARLRPFLKIVDANRGWWVRNTAAEPPLKLCVTNTSLRSAMLECKHLTVQYHVDARSLLHVKLQISMWLLHVNNLVPPSHIFLMVVKHLLFKPHTYWVGTGERCLWARSVPHQKLWRGSLCFLAARTSVIV